MVCLLVVLLFPAISNAQIPDASRRANWHKAGIHGTLPDYKHLAFAGDTTGTIDNSTALQAILDTISQPTIILFGEGTYLFNTRISLKSNTILKGLGHQRTHFLFNQNGTDQPSIQMRGTESGNYALTQAADKNSNSALVSPASAAKFKAGDYCRILQDDADLLQTGWGEGITGQVLKIDSVVADRLYFSSALRMDYPMARNPRLRKQNNIKFSGVECLKITRSDYTNTGAGSSNFDIRVAANCHISSVESNKCNYAHVEVYYSTNIMVEDNYFYDAHNFGSDGRGYGVILHFSTGEALVQNNVFRKLRHAMILQAGANGNVFAYNYSYESTKQIFPGINVVGEDMDCHGNYPYLNLFEGNYGQFASVDNSHGMNGPYNTYFRNIATNAGFGVSNPQSPNQNFTGNHTISGSNNFASSGHHITDNSWQGASALNDSSLAYQATPPFLQGVANWLIGPPAFNANPSLPARSRAASSQYISRKCDMIIWENGDWKNNFKPSALTQDYTMVVYPGGNLVLSNHATVKSLDIKPGANFELAPGYILTVNE